MMPIALTNIYISIATEEDLLDSILVSVKEVYNSSGFWDTKATLIPKVWKKVNVVPVTKVDPNEVSNFCPISRCISNISHVS